MLGRGLVPKTHVFRAVPSMFADSILSGDHPHRAAFPAAEENQQVKTRSGQGAVVAFARTAALVVVGGIVMTATARMASMADARSAVDSPPSAAARPGVRVDATVDIAAVVDLRPDRTGVVSVDPARLQDLAVDDEIEISPRADLASERFKVKRTRRDGIGSRWWHLDSTEFEESQAVLVERRGLVSIWLFSPAFGDAFEWRFQSIGRGRMIPVPGDPNEPGCGGEIRPEMGPEVPVSLARQGVGDAEPCSGCSSLEADIAFFYTPRALVEAEMFLTSAGGDPEEAPDLIALRCAQEAANTSLVMSNSDLPFGTRAVHVSMVDWVEPATWRPDEAVLNTFANPIDGEMDGIHAIRELVGADACSLITATDGGNGFGGVAFLGNGLDAGLAFNQLVWSSLGGLILAHEFGHNLGCRHAAGDNGASPKNCDLWEPSTAQCCAPDVTTGPDVPEPSFNHGWRWVNPLNVPNCVRTVMAYSESGSNYVPQVPHYSNPDTVYLGTPTGSPEDAPDGRWADNALQIRLTMPGTTTFECEIPAQAAASGRLIAAGLGEADFFGSSVATNGYILAAGASGHNVAAQDAGAVFLFEDLPEDDPDESWIQTSKLTPFDLAEGDLFGYSVAMDEGVLVVGAPYTSRVVVDELTGEVLETYPLAGEVSVWIEDGTGRYCRIQSLQPEDLASYDQFGWSVAVAGDLIAVGAPRREASSGGGANHGAVWLYRRVGDVYEIFGETIEGEDGSAWQTGGTGTGGRFGTSVAAAVQPGGQISLVVGAPRERIGYGQVHPYVVLTGADGDPWSLLEGSPVNGNWDLGRLGTSVAISSDDVIAGAPGANNTRGAAIMYRMVGTDLNPMGVLEYQNDEGDLAGTSVAISDVFAAIGVPGRDRRVEIAGQPITLEDVGAVVVFSRPLGSSGWSIRQQKQPDDLREGDAFGGAVAVAANRLIVGAAEADDTALLSGAVYALDILNIEDCNGNDIDDSLEILENPELDHNLNGKLDECEANCAADLNEDGEVDGADLGLLFVHWGLCPGGEVGCPGDLDLNGQVDGGDLGIFCASWGLLCPGEPGP